MADENKIVHFWDYCQKCVHYEDDETMDPCNECLDNPANYDSHMPINFTEK